MRKEYENKINKMFRHYHLNNERGMPASGYSFDMLKHSLNHLYFLAICSDEEDTDTINEIQTLIARVHEGYIPQQAGLSGVDMLASARENKTLCIKSPAVVSIELTPEVYEGLLGAIGGRNL